METMKTSLPPAMLESARDELRPERIAWIDVARGIGILLVVLGHLESGLSNRVIYAFHIPFFFLSGYVHKTQAIMQAYFESAVSTSSSPMSRSSFCSFPWNFIAPPTVEGKQFRRR
jgi:uncharacterized membrane protein YcfT